MVEYKSQDYTTAKQILVFPDHYVAVAHTFLRNDATAVVVDGRSIIKAGTIYPANGATAMGVVFNDIDITDGDKAGALIIHGFVKTAALPAVPASAAVGALKGVQFLPITPATVSLTVTPLAIAVGEAADTTHSVKVAISGAHFRPEAATLTNWTIAGASTTKVGVDSIVVSADGSYITVNTKNTAEAVAGSLTIVPLAAATSTGAVPAAAVTIATVA